MLRDAESIQREIAALRAIRHIRTGLEQIVQDYDLLAARISEAEPEELMELRKLILHYSTLASQFGSDIVMRRYFRHGTQALERLQGILNQRLKQLPRSAIPTIQIPQPQTARQRTEFAPTLDNIVDYYRAKGLVGEESTCIVQTLGAMHLMSFGIESLSGSGKSHMAEMLIELLPEGAVYRLVLSSNTAEMYDAEQINRCKIIYIPELQKAMRTTNPNPIMVEVLKSITEGKDATRKVRDQQTGANRQYTITAGKGVIFTLAVENDFKYDAELSRRVFILYTDVSQEQTERVLRYKAERRHAAQAERQTEEAYNSGASLKAHIAQCMGMRFAYENPFADIIAESVPRTIRARSYADYLFGLIEASAKFHHRNRLAEKGVLFINMEDVHETYRHYWKQFVMGLLRVPLLAEQALAAFEPGLQIDVQEAYERMKGPASTPSPAYGFQLVKNTLEGLVAAGMLKKDDHESRRPMYTKTKELPLEAPMDWELCFRAGADYMRDNYPQLAEKWLGMQAGFLNRIGLYGNG